VGDACHTGRVRHGQQDKRGRARKAWHGVKLGQPGWGEHFHSLAFEAQLRREGLRVYLILNAYSESLEF
jgi:isoamylase